MILFDYVRICTKIDFALRKQNCDIILQVEFYFSDSNLPRDDFLKKSISESEDGMISLALICSFSRMRGHLNLGDVKADSIPEDSVKAVAETLKKSTTLKISEDGEFLFGLSLFVRQWNASNIGKKKHI